MITIAIPTRNEERQIGLLLESLCSQDISEPYEVIIADAHSTDTTPAIIDSFKTRIPQLLVVEGGKPAQARNNAARAATGDIIFFIDADTVPSGPTFLRENAAFFRNRKLVAGITKLYPRSKRVDDRFSGMVANGAMWLMQYIHPLGAMCIAVRRDVWERTGGYPEDVLLAEDHDLLNACAKCGRIRMLPIGATFSVRRYEKEGRFFMNLKYIYATLYHLFRGPIRKPLFTYEFTYSKETDI